MLQRDLHSRDIVHNRVLAVMGKVPKYLFVDNSLKKMAYSDIVYPLGRAKLYHSLM